MTDSRRSRGHAEGGGGGNGEKKSGKRGRKKIKNQPVGAPPPPPPPPVTRYSAGCRKFVCFLFVVFFFFHFIFYFFFQRRVGGFFLSVRRGLELFPPLFTITARPTVFFSFLFFQIAGPCRRNQGQYYSYCSRITVVISLLSITLALFHYIFYYIILSYNIVFHTFPPFFFFFCEFYNRLFSHVNCFFLIY